MHIRRTLPAVAVAAILAGTIALSAGSNGTLTIAVYGDSPYGTSSTDTTQTFLTPSFIGSINADSDVALVLHVGDIHSGKQFCTQAYDQLIYNLWLSFVGPLVYTPGDNEWTDCNKKGEGGDVYLDPPTNSMPVDYAAGNPIANLTLIRQIFFSNPGHTLGQKARQVTTQAQNYDAVNHPTDANYVENVMWEQNGVLFVTINLPGGSNNDADIWFGAASMTQPQTDEIQQRSGADLRWLDAAFGRAAANGDRAVVIGTQADMWDRDGRAVDHIDHYDQFISSIASHTSAFGGPVLLFNGDSHHFRSDNPLKQGQPCQFESGVGSTTVDCNSIPDPGDGTYTQDAWTNHPYYNVSNFHRIVVHGSTLPLEWLRVSITPRVSAPRGGNAFGPFLWQRIQPAL
ncbi:MAG: hypothetical protein DMF89_01170 [Acidobacteria bacterium]|nr:MAG: hypothetical protein DMF90_14680 [Acidobacteriota bacterium]PYR52913.1 MAG: hypothetical protein DMF89_01170 [Acidobacteriota bacterium]